MDPGAVVWDDMRKVLMSCLACFMCEIHVGFFWKRRIRLLILLFICVCVCVWCTLCRYNVSGLSLCIDIYLSDK